MLRATGNLRHTHCFEVFSAALKHVHVHCASNAVQLTRIVALPEFPFAAISEARLTDAIVTGYPVGNRQNARLDKYCRIFDWYK